MTSAAAGEMDISTEGASVLLLHAGSSSAKAMVREAALHPAPFAASLLRMCGMAFPPKRQLDGAHVANLFGARQELVNLLPLFVFPRRDNYMPGISLRWP
jgi:hypothetical protein